MTETWDKLPLAQMDDLAESESYRRDVYRPVYSLHKWWARRPGSTFRILGLAALTDDSVTNTDIIQERESGSHDGLYLDTDNEKIDSDVTILDPFTGGGVTHAELNRLGAETVGYELNPVAWFITKKSVDEVDTEQLEHEFESLLSDVQDELGEYLHTTDSSTGQDCPILYSFQTQVVPCQTCEEEVRLFKNYKLGYKKSNAPAAVYCPNQECSQRIIELDREVKDEETCPNCHTTFDPNDGNSGYGKYTCSNGHKHDIKETLGRLDKKPEFEYYALQYVDPHGEKRFKEFDEDDAENVTELENLVEQNDIVIPDQEIPAGDKTRALHNYNYTHFHELFTDRQLAVHGTIFQRALEVEDANIREFLILAASNMLNFNCKLCRWHVGNQKGLDVFERHAYVPKTQPVEPNPLNEHGTLGSLRNAFGKLHDAKKYCNDPFEKIKNRKSGEVVKHEILNESVDEDLLQGLHCKTAERMDLPNESVEYVITDPPYYDNVQYSELADYFYVWLQKCLHSEYEEFEPKVSPKAREIVANNQVGKDEEFFIDSLSNVFSECHRVLKSDGEMVFTYHHNENEAWSVILESIINSGFTITGAYPVQSDRDNSPHISDLDNAEYDILIYANKEQANEEITLTELRQNLFFELKEMAAEERERHNNLSKPDLGVILRGKCMYYYSRHYPNVFSEGDQVSIDEALDTVDSIIEQVLEGEIDLPRAIDPITQAYASFCQRGAEEYDDLNKNLLAKNLNVGDLEDEKLVKGPRDKKEPVTADERITFIEAKLNKNGKDGDELLDIDKVQYLYHLYKTDQNTVEYLKEWKTEELEDLADFMADVTGDERYENVMDMGITQF